jgi:hypothetical protein
MTKFGTALAATLIALLGMLASNGSAEAQRYRAERSTETWGEYRFGAETYPQARTERSARGSRSARTSRSARSSRSARTSRADRGGSYGSLELASLTGSYNAGPRPRQWCGWWMRTQLGGGPEYNLAWNWRKYGSPASPQVGAVVVWRHHVGIIVGEASNGKWLVRSGNWGGRVATAARSIRGAVVRI